MRRGFHSTTMCEVAAFFIRGNYTVTSYRLRSVAVPRIHDERDPRGPWFLEHFSQDRLREQTFTDANDDLRRRLYPTSISLCAPPAFVTGNYASLAPPGRVAAR